MNDSCIEVNILPEHSDTYGHLNNAFYSYYFEKGRVALQMANGIGDDELKERGMGLWVQDTYVNRSKQLHRDQEVKVVSSFIGHSGIMLYMKHELVVEGKRMSHCISEHFFVKLGEDPAPIEIPVPMKEGMEELTDMNKQLPGVISVLEFVAKREKEDRIRAIMERKKGNAT